jgi:hypothetical protein
MTWPYSPARHSRTKQCTTHGRRISCGPGPGYRTLAVVLGAVPSCAAMCSQSERQLIHRLAGGRRTCAAAQAHPHCCPSPSHRTNRTRPACAEGGARGHAISRWAVAACDTAGVRNLLHACLIGLACRGRPSRCHCFIRVVPTLHRPALTPVQPVALAPC